MNNDIKIRRLRLGMTQKQLADACNVPLQCIIAAESFCAEKQPLIDIIKLASGLHALEVERGWRNE